MKNAILLFAISALSFNSIAQNSDIENNGKLKIELPTKDNEIFVEKVYQVDSSLTKDAMFIRAKAWLLNLYSTDKKEQIIDIEDKEQGKLIGRGYVSFTQTNFGAVPNRVSFKYDITIKDGKYKVQFYNFGNCQIWDNFSGAITGAKAHWADDWTIKKLYQYYQEDKGRKKVIASKIEPFSKELNRLLEELNKKMSTKEDDF